MMHHITSIIDIQPYTISVVFDGKETRKINFEPLLKNFPVLQNPKVFLAAKLDDYPTLMWAGLAKIKELNGAISLAPLDFCPDSLYMMSVPV